jgi:hypothetical protein
MKKSIELAKVARISLFIRKPQEMTIDNETCQGIVPVMEKNS